MRSIFGKCIAIAMMAAIALAWQSPPVQAAHDDNDHAVRAAVYASEARAEAARADRAANRADDAVERAETAADEAKEAADDAAEARTRVEDLDAASAVEQSRVARASLFCWYSFWQSGCCGD